jgi:SPP1 family predicted phage head-tail adaptor
MPEGLPSIGELDRRIELQHNTPSGSNDYNEPISSWATYDEVWAMLEFHRSTESEASAREFADFGAYFTIRHRTDVLAEDRIVYESNIYEIIGRPRELGRRQYLKVQARLVE